MAFDIILYSNLSEANKVDKELITLSTINGTLRDVCSIVNPIIRAEVPISTLANCNYIYIPTFNRYYFIASPVLIRTGLVEITAHCDVISSFKEQIRRQKAIINKQQKRWNLYLNDDTLKTYQNPEVLAFKFPSGFTKQEFVLAIAGPQQ